MPKVRANNLTMNYDQQGTGEALILIPYLAADYACYAFDAESQLSRIKAPTQITFGRRDVVTSTRFANRLTNVIHGSEVVIFEESSHTPIYEKVDEFNQRTLAFLRKHAG